MLARVSIAAAAAAVAAATCDAGTTCTYNIDFQGSTYSYNLRGLCNIAQDYVIQDVARGHTFYAQICGSAQRSCLPSEWVNEYEYGAVVQTWGSAPPCNPANASTMGCAHVNSGVPACCTDDCEVVGLPGSIQVPTAVPLNNDDLSQGIAVTFLGEQPTADEPYQCPPGPDGLPYLRTTRFELYCDATATGFAVLYETEQTDAEPCLYVLKFRTNAVCQGPGVSAIVRTLSPGWVFNILLIVTLFVYIVGGAVIGYRKSGLWELPNAEFWSGVGDLIGDGIRFAFTCGGRLGGGAGARRGGGFATAGVATSGSSGAFIGSTDAAPAAPAFGGPRSYTDL